MDQFLFWLYLANAVLLINHEIDSAYWREWEMFRLPGGISGFLIIHFPMLFFVLYGLVLVYEATFAGRIFALVLGLAGIFAFSIHMFFIKRGNEAFKTPLSLLILISTLPLSLAQVAISIYLLAE